MSSLDARKLTWAALLGRWVEFARSALALPQDAAGRAWKAAVPHIIGLQAITAALRDLDLLIPEERPLGLDRARLLIEQHTTALNHIFSAPLHPLLTEIIAESHQALRSAEQTYSPPR